jgi:hypothetical protein
MEDFLEAETQFLGELECYLKWSGILLIISICSFLLSIASFRFI